jgi:hypothetical protein
VSVDNSVPNLAVMSMALYSCTDKDISSFPAKCTICYSSWFSDTDYENKSRTNIINITLKNGPEIVSPYSIFLRKFPSYFPPKT